ncbi:MAG: unsaturated acyl-CoA hydratase, partial [Promethearchaeota archaeon CR_4]
MSSKLVELVVVENNTVAIVSLNRPDALNTLTLALSEDFYTVVQQIIQDSKIRAVILTGNGKAFCAGGDLASFKAAKEPGQFLHDLAG